MGKNEFQDALDPPVFKFQNGRQAPGMVRPTFFLSEINRKFFFPAWGFHILATRKDDFHHPEGSQ